MGRGQGRQAPDKDKSPAAAKAEKVQRTPATRTRTAAPSRRWPGGAQLSPASQVQKGVGRGHSGKHTAMPSPGEAEPGCTHQQCPFWEVSRWHTFHARPTALRTAALQSPHLPELLGGGCTILLGCLLRGTCTLDSSLPQSTFASRTLDSRLGGEGTGHVAKKSPHIT